VLRPGRFDRPTPRPVHKVLMLDREGDSATASTTLLSRFAPESFPGPPVARALPRVSGRLTLTLRRTRRIAGTDTQPSMGLNLLRGRARTYSGVSHICSFRSFKLESAFGGSMFRCQVVRQPLRIAVTYGKRGTIEALPSYLRRE